MKDAPRQFVLGPLNLQPPNEVKGIPQILVGNDIKDIYAEAKSAGFDVKVMRQLIRIRKQEPAEVEEQETLLDVYRRALGM